VAIAKGGELIFQETGKFHDKDTRLCTGEFSSVDITMYMCSMMTYFRSIQMFLMHFICFKKKESVIIINV